ncbi:hypothetical protein SNEBB_009997 [Seison nebaliae]|nr:hypothetical protein SNEBB_009997 [Seison nebaliae]
MYEYYEDFFDAHGRLLEPMRMKQMVFNNYANNEMEKTSEERQIRKETWKYMFNVYQNHQTNEEKLLVERDLFIQYVYMKAKWRKELLDCFVTIDRLGNSTIVETGIATINDEEYDTDDPLPDTSVELHWEKVENHGQQVDSNHNSWTPASFIKFWLQIGSNNSVNAEMAPKTILSATKLPERLRDGNVGNVDICKMNASLKIDRKKTLNNMKLFESSLKMIDKDIPRTARLPKECYWIVENNNRFKLKHIDSDAYKESINSNNQIDRMTNGKDKYIYFIENEEDFLLRLRSVLATFCAFNPDIPYSQGMNDICSLFLLVLQSEYEAYWCFTKYICSSKNDFEDYTRKLKLIGKIMSVIEKELHEKFITLQSDRYIMCHRWILLSFKREFNHFEALRCFEAINSKFIDASNWPSKYSLSFITDREYKCSTSGDEYVLVSHNQIESDNSNNESNRTNDMSDFTFDLFICVAIFHLKHHQFMMTNDDSEVISLCNNLSGKLKLNDIIPLAVEAFHRFFEKQYGQQSRSS